MTLLMGIISCLGVSESFGGLVIYQFGGEIGGRTTANNGQPNIGPLNAAGDGAEGRFLKGDAVTFTVSYDTANPYPFTIQSFTITSQGTAYSPFVSTNTDGTGNVAAVDGGANNDTLTFDTGTPTPLVDNFNSPKVYRANGNPKRANSFNQRIKLELISTNGSNPLTGDVPPPLLNFDDWNTTKFQIDFDLNEEFSVAGTFTSMTVATPEPATVTAMIAMMCLGWYGFKHRKGQMELATAVNSDHSGKE